MRTEIEKIHYAEIDSTSTEAGKLVREQDVFERPILVSADRQNAGRGRQGKSFLSPEGGIYFTFAIPDAYISGDYIGLTSFAALCVCESLEKFSSSVPKIKWVNDIYVDDRKVCGILTERLTDKNYKPLGVLIGIGINTREFDLPPELQGTVGFVNIDDSQKDKLVEDICLRLLTYGGSLAPYISEIRVKSCVIGRNITYFSNGVATDGKALDITNDGGLLVSSCGRQVVLSSGELSLRFDGDARL